MNYIDHRLSAAALRRGREQLGLSQRQLAYQLRMEPATFSACENARRRFPLQRLPMLPAEIQEEVRNALVAEFAEELDRKIAMPRIPPKRRTMARKRLVPAE